jgi:hypothetical protein
MPPSEPTSEELRQRSSDLDAARTTSMHAGLGVMPNLLSFEKYLFSALGNSVNVFIGGRT